MAGQPYILVYADIVLLSNFCLDYLSLWLAGRLTGRPGGRLRMAAAAALGSAFALAAELWPYGPANGLGCKAAVSVLMVALGLKPADRRWLLRLLTGFYLAAFALGGSAFGLAYFLGGAWRRWTKAGGVWPAELLTGLPLPELPALWLALGACFCIGAIALAARRRRGLERQAARQVLEAELCWKSASCGLKILIDTGCQLYEPVSGLPVLVTTLGALSRSPDLGARLGALDLPALARLPCRGLNGPAELPVLGRAQLLFADGRRESCWLALAPLPLDAAGDYDALMPPPADIAAPLPKSAPPSEESPEYKEAPEDEPPADISL